MRFAAVATVNSCASKVSGGVNIVRQPRCKHAWRGRVRFLSTCIRIQKHISLCVLYSPIHPLVCFRSSSPLLPVRTKLSRASLSACPWWVICCAGADAYRRVSFGRQRRSVGRDRLSLQAPCCRHCTLAARHAARQRPYPAWAETSPFARLRSPVLPSGDKGVTRALGRGSPTTRSTESTQTVLFVVQGTDVRPSKLGCVAS